MNLESIRDGLRQVDWSTALGLPPKRRFTAEELARAQARQISPTVVVSLVLNLALPLGLAALVLADAESWPLLLVLKGFGIGLVLAGLQVWRDPSSRASRLAYWLLPLGTSAAVFAVASRTSLPRHALMLTWGELMVGTLALWFCVVYRHHHIESRLRELDERDRAIEMARRLAAAQIEPHFLFNSLASAQHWVDTADARTAPFLRSLTGYLRATLPMFGRPLHPLAEELVATTRYLEVMQARLGERLAWRIEVEPALQAAPLPPGALLTLVENAVEHGIGPRLRDGHIILCAWQSDGLAQLSVRDNGPGPAPASAAGAGLSNVRERLQLAFGERASLSLRSLPEGGAEARIAWPWSER